MRVLIAALLAAVLQSACGSPDARPRSLADGRPDPVQAMGNEPFWNVSISQADGVVYTRLGEDTVSFPYVAPRRTEEEPASYTYGPIDSATDDHSILVVIVDEPCQDTMADQVHPMRSVVRMDLEELHGCARPLTRPAAGEPPRP